MKFLIKPLIIVITLSALIFSGLSSVNATPTGAVWTTSSGASSPINTVFKVGDTVYIFWHIDVNPVNVDIIISEDQNGDHPVATVVTNRAYDNQPVEWTAAFEGKYYVIVYDHTTHEQLNSAAIICSSTLQITVVPESLLGAVTAIGAAFGTFGFLKYRKSKL
ncbi:MAG: hypothetical protein IAX22_05255 [Candidatus Bathyarchaeota archaeon]|jgi:hypothetical protein|nr:hypothetical protein [Candidatus Bathyarchaeota archaeon]